MWQSLVMMWLVVMWKLCDGGRVVVDVASEEVLCGHVGGVGGRVDVAVAREDVAGGRAAVSGWWSCGPGCCS
jgi:hypothetical protein